jgi:hypothetical protein
MNTFVSADASGIVLAFPAPTFFFPLLYLVPENFPEYYLYLF